MLRAVLALLIFATQVAASPFPPDAPLRANVTIDRLYAFPTATWWGNQMNGDNSMSPVQVQTVYSAANGNPFGPVGNRYTYAPHITPVFVNTAVLPDVGWNSSNSSNGPGRTAITGIRSRIDHFGQGDAAAVNAAVWVGGTRAGSTHYLANPAGSLFNGSIAAGASGVYLNTIETVMNDAGHDVAAIGHVMNQRRSRDTGNLSVVWDGLRIQSQGTKNTDSGVRIDGGVNVGINLTRQTRSDAAIVLRRGQRVYFDGAANGEARTHTGDTYMQRTDAGLLFVVGGVPVLRMAPDGINFLVPVTP